MLFSKGETVIQITKVQSLFNPNDVQIDWLDWYPSKKVLWILLDFWIFGYQSSIQCLPLQYRSIFENVFYKYKGQQLNRLRLNVGNDWAHSSFCLLAFPFCFYIWILKSLWKFMQSIKPPIQPVLCSISKARFSMIKSHSATVTL